MKVGTRLRGAFAIYIALLAVVVVYHVRTLQRAVESGQTLSAIASRIRAIANDEVARVTRMSNDAEKFLVTHDRGYVDDLAATAARYAMELTGLNTASLTAAERAQFTPLLASWREAERSLAQVQAVNVTDTAAVRVVVGELQTKLDAIRAGTLRLGAASQDAMTSELRDSELAAVAAERVSWLAAAGALVLSIVLSALLVRSIVAPLERLTEGTRAVSGGRFGHRLEAKGNDELAQVTRDFNSMTERLDELDRMKRDFVAKVSHDLKTPLSSMQETIGVLLDEVPGPLTETQRRLLDLNQESGRRLAAMLGKLLDLSRIEAGLEPDFELLDLMQVIDRAVTHATPAGSARGVSITVTHPTARLLVRGDASGLMQVVDNLIENAVKFSEPGGAVRVTVAEQTARGNIPAARWAVLRKNGLRGLRGGAVLLSVADEGPGIPDEDKERVFARFYQTDAGRAVRGRGVGLGLTICQEIIAAHGGAIWADDNEPRGTVFHVLLPGAVRVPDDLARPALAMGALVLALTATGCATSRFDRLLSQERWMDAAQVFSADSSLLNDEGALYRAAVLFSSPGRPTYDPDHARTLLQRLLVRYPAGEHAEAARDRLALLDDARRVREDAEIRIHDAETNIAALEGELNRLRARLDTTRMNLDGARRTVARLESEARDREEQLRNLRLELERLKAIDLKPRSGRPPG
jgi:two-component system sensor histidine kinase GlrK